MWVTENGSLRDINLLADKKELLYKYFIELAWYLSKRILSDLVLFIISPSLCTSPAGQSINLPNTLGQQNFLSYRSNKLVQLYVCMYVCIGFTGGCFLHFP